MTMWQQEPMSAQPEKMGYRLGRTNDCFWETGILPTAIFRSKDSRFWGAVRS